MESIVGDNAEEDDFLAMCSGKEIVKMQAAQGKFEKALLESTRIWKSLTTEALPFEDENSDLKLKCKAMSVKWGVLTLVKRLGETLSKAANAESKEALKALYNKHLKDCDQEFKKNLPEGLIDEVMAILDGSQEEVPQEQKGQKPQGKKAASSEPKGKASSEPREQKGQKPQGKKPQGKKAASQGRKGRLATSHSSGQIAG